MKKTIINLTPHAINLPNQTVEPSGTVARCEEITESIGYFNDILLVHKKYGNVYDLPEPQPDTLYIVSMMVRQALPGRIDIASPGDLVRDEVGRIVACINLVIN